MPGISHPTRYQTSLRSQDNGSVPAIRLSIGPYAIAVLRVCYHNIKDDELKDAYDNSFLSEVFPSVALSRNSVSQFHKDVGKTCSKITQFMRNRVSNNDFPNR